MSRQSIIDRVQTPVRCDADWDSMIGNDQVRFCEHCAKDVYNISAMTRRKAEELVVKSKGRLCAKYYRSPDGAIQTEDRLSALNQITRRASRLAAGAFTVALTLSSGIAAQQSKSADATTAGERKAAKPDANQSTNSISGTLVDPNGAVIFGASVKVTNEKTNAEFSVISGEDGKFSAANIVNGSYTIFVAAAGFSNAQIVHYEVSDTKNEPLTISLQVAANEGTMGIVVISEPTDLLVRAAKDDNLEGVSVLLEVGMDVNKVDEALGTTALYHAVKNNDIEMVRLLLANGARINGVESPDEEDKTKMSIHGPAFAGISDNTNLEMIDELIRNGADPNSKDSDGTSAIIAVSDTKNNAILQKLIAMGANVNDRDKLGRTPLMFAAGTGNIDNVKTLIAVGADADSQDSEGRSALVLSSFQDSTEVVKLLLDAGANVNLKDNGGASALAKYVLYDHSDVIIPMLLKRGAKVDDRDNDGTTAMMNAAEYGDLDSVKLLLDAGADLNLRDKDGDTALSKAIKNDHKGSNAEVIQYLRLHGAVE